MDKLTCATVGPGPAEPDLAPTAWDDPVMVGLLLDLPEVPGAVLWRRRADEPPRFFVEGRAATFSLDAGWVGGPSDLNRRESLACLILRRLLPRLRPVLRAIAEKGDRDFVLLSRADYDRLVDRSKP